MPEIEVSEKRQGLHLACFRSATVETKENSPAQTPKRPGKCEGRANPSRRFASTIGDHLRRIGCDATAAITERAIEAAKQADASGDGRAKRLSECDAEFYRLNEVEPRLFRYIEAHQDQIRLTKRSLPPKLQLKPLSPASRVHTQLLCSRPDDRSLENIRNLARELVRKEAIPATDGELEAAAVLYAFGRGIRADDFVLCERLAPQAFETSREDPFHCVVHCEWIIRLLQTSQGKLADHWTLVYLEYLRGRDQSDLSTRNGIRFWGTEVLQKYRADLPKSVEFFLSSFPDIDLDKLVSTLRFVRVPRPRGGRG